MTYEEAKETAKNYLEDYLRGQGIDTSKAFSCINPEHNDRHPSMRINPKNRAYCKCFSCDAYYDVFDVVAIYNGLERGSKEAFIKTFEELGINIDDQRQTTSKGKKTTSNANKTALSTKEAPLDTINIDTEVETACKTLYANEDAIKHFKARGLSEKTIKDNKLGYSPEGMNALLKAYPTHKKHERGQGFYKYIIPIMKDGKPINFISEIDDRKHTDDYNKKYAKVKETTDTLYLIDNLKTKDGFIFVCEGYFDALSLEEIGQKAVALGGTAQDRLLDQLTDEAIKRNNKYIIATDNDKVGRKTAVRLAEGLKKKGIPYIILTLPYTDDTGADVTADFVKECQSKGLLTYRVKENPLNSKDINDLLVSDRQKFEQLIADVTTYASKTQEELLSEEYEQLSASNRISALTSAMSKYCKPPTSTGFSKLDDILEDGIRTGLYTLGAVTGLGKTTFALQLADFIASTGTDVLYFSLEMTEAELMAKSISRHTFQRLERGFKRPDGSYEGGLTPKTTNDVVLGYRHEQFTEAEENLIIEASKEYRLNVKNTLYIVDGLADIGTDDIKQRIERHITARQNKPVVFVDYLQILKSKDVRLSDKQKIDENIVDLKRISRDYDIPLFVISATNRTSYTDPIDLTSFKESGSIEFTSDVMLGLQYRGMDYELVKKTDKETQKEYFEREGKDRRNKRINKLLREQLEKSRNNQPQDIELKVLKNRHGKRTGDKGIYLDFYPFYNCYVETTDNKWSYDIDDFVEENKQETFI